MSWYRGFEPICQPDASLSDHTWYRLGGPARWFFRPRQQEETVALLARCRAAEVAWRVLGRGANVLVRDEGFDGAVIHLAGPQLESVQYDGEQVLVGAAADFPKLVRDTLEHGLLGLENLAGIPGTLGGVIRMNAGGKYGEIGQFVRHVRVVERDGAVAVRPALRVGFGYRRTDLDGCVVLGATLSLREGDRQAGLARHREIWNEKYATQPPVGVRSAGCIFKNPPGHKAGLLLDQAGLKGRRVGGAEISARHANFIVAYEGARASDVLELIALARDRVWNHSGVELEMEIEVW
jgi:UDP-N-acetylmuramate dehydrogenase